MRTIEFPQAEVEQKDICPACGSVGLWDGEKTDLDGRVLAEFYECGNPDCDCMWWVGIED